MRFEEETLRPVIQAAFDQGGLDGVCRLVVTLLNEMEDRHQAAVAKLEARIGELEKRLNQNSSNSSKPPSSDGLKRGWTNRGKGGGRKPGGQTGHPGSSLKASEALDKIETILLDVCPDCGSNLEEVPVVAVEKRQVFDLPPIRMEVTEYRAQRKSCPCCRRPVTARFPAHAPAPVQYGPGIQAVMAYLNVRQLVPCARTAEICQDFFGHRPGAGSVVQAVSRLSGRLASAVEGIRDSLIKAPVLHADETGVRCGGKTGWVHVAGTATASHYNYSGKRGVGGFAEAGLLPDYRGLLVHDFWGPYDTLDCKHARCNAHLLRELKACEEDDHVWAEQIILGLLAMKKAADEAREKGWVEVAPEEKVRLLRFYDRWVSKGLEAHPERAAPTGKRGRAKQSTEHNLLRRLRDKREEVTRFLHDLLVPFDNNQAERDLRMIKVQQKVSGCFRGEEGASRFCTIMSYISTVRKQGLDVMGSIQDAFMGRSVALGS